MNFLEVVSLLANLLTALSVTAHFLHSVWRWRTSVSVRLEPMARGRTEEGRGECTPPTDELELGSVRQGED